MHYGDAPSAIADLDAVLDFEHPKFLAYVRTRLFLFFYYIYLFNDYLIIYLILNFVHLLVYLFITCCVFRPITSEGRPTSTSRTSGGLSTTKPRRSSTTRSCSMPTSTGTRAFSFLFTVPLLLQLVASCAHAIRTVCVCVSCVCVCVCATNRSTCYDLVGMTKEAAEDKQKYARLRRAVGHAGAWTNHEREHSACCQV
jgi:hypothetical protein